MRIYGSVTNRFEENKLFCDRSAIAVGTGATEYLWSDSHAYEVIEVISLNPIHVKVRRMHSIPQECVLENECENYVYEHDPKGDVVELQEYHGTLCPVTKGPTGRTRHDTSGHWSLGVMQEYYDPSF